MQEGAANTGDVADEKGKDCCKSDGSMVRPCRDSAMEGRQGYCEAGNSTKSGMGAVCVKKCKCGKWVETVLLGR